MKQMVQTTATRLHLIGVPFVRLGDERLALPNRKLLALMAVLALDGPTERARLAELIWSGLDDARGRLRRELSRLRKTSGAALVLEEKQTLRLGEISIDLEDFRLAIKKHDWELAQTLGRGTLLEGFYFDSPEFDEWLEFHRVSFDESYRSVLLQHGLQLEKTGSHQEALEVFERLQHLDALNEEAVRGAMRSLEALDDTTKMLAIYKQFSQKLEFELGIQPDLETQKLAAKARGERLELAPVISARLPKIQNQNFSSDTPLRGREQAWAQLEEAWETGNTILISGEPGMGKTRLMLEFVASKTKPLERILTVHRHADTQTALSGMTRLLRDLWRIQSTEKLPTWARSELARLLPELGEPNFETNTENGQARLLAALTEFTKLFGNDMQLFMKDDIQFMDAATWELGQKLTFSTDQPVRTIMTYRKGELTDTIQTDIDAMLESEQAVLIELEGLELNAVHELVRANFKTTPAEQLEPFSQRLHAFTGGNPLFVLETLKAIEHSVIAPDMPLPRVRKVREVINLRLKRLSKPARDLVRVAAIAVEQFSLELAAQVLGGDSLDFSEATFELEQTGIMQDGRFTHDALYENALEGIPKPARVLLHSRVLAILETQPKMRGTANVYLRHAQGAQNPVKILEWSVLAAKEATERFAYAEALAHYDQALELETDPRKSFEYLWLQTRIYRTQGQREAWGKVVEGMLWQAAQTLDPELEARAAIAEIDLLLERADYKDALDCAQRLLERPTLRSEQRGMTLIYAAHALSYLDKHVETESYLLEAEPLIPPQDYESVSLLNSRLRNSAVKRNDLAEARRRNAMALEAFRRANNRSGEIGARLSAASLAEKMGDIDAAKLNYQAGIERAQEAGDLPLQRYAAFAMANFYANQLDIEQAKPWVAKGLQLSLEPPDIKYEGIFHGQQAYLYGFDGELHKMLEAGIRALNCYQKLGLVPYQAQQHEWFAHRLLELGQYKAAFEHIEEGEKLAQQNQLEEQIAYFLLVRARCSLYTDHGQEAYLLLESMLRHPEELLPSREFPTRVVLAQSCIERGLFEKAAFLLSKQERLTIDEVCRLAIQLRLQIAQGFVQQDTLETAEKLLALSVPPNHALELQFAMVSAFRVLGLNEKAANLLADAQKNQKRLVSSLQIEHQSFFIKHLKTFHNL